MKNIKSELGMAECHPEFYKLFIVSIYLSRENENPVDYFSPPLFVSGRWTGFSRPSSIERW